MTACPVRLEHRREANQSSSSDAEWTGEELQVLDPLQDPKRSLAARKIRVDPAVVTGLQNGDVGKNIEIP